MPFTRASERPSGSQDVVAQSIDSADEAAIVAACILQGRLSSYVSVSAEQQLNPDALPRLPPGSGGFLLVRGLVAAGVTSKRNRQGKETRDV
jgi:hypothetical protein